MNAKLLANLFEIFFSDQPAVVAVTTVYKLVVDVAEGDGFDIQSDAAHHPPLGRAVDPVLRLHPGRCLDLDGAPAIGSRLLHLDQTVVGAGVQPGAPVPAPSASRIFQIVSMDLPRMIQAATPPASSTIRVVPQLAA